MWHDMGWGGGMWLWPFLWLIFIAVIVWAVVRFAVGNQGTSPPAEFRETPLDILKRRYANGEINREQFEQMKKDLKS